MCVCVCVCLKVTSSRVNLKWKMCLVHRFNTFGLRLGVCGDVCDEQKLHQNLADVERVGCHHSASNGARTKYGVSETHDYHNMH